jgi:hypothetical protein
VRLTFNDRVRELLKNPPPDSGVAKAMARGLDLSLTVRNMFGRTPAQRLRAFDEGAAWLEFLKRRRP